MEDFLNKLKSNAQIWFKNFRNDILGNAAWVFLLLLSLWNYGQADSYIKQAPTVMQEIAAMEVAIKGAIFLSGAVIVYYLRGIYKELQNKNNEKEKTSKK